MEAEIGMTHGQAKDCWKSPEVRKRQAKILPEGLQREHGLADTLISYLQPPDLWKDISIVLSHAVCGTLLQVLENEEWMCGK